MLIPLYCLIYELCLSLLYANKTKVPLLQKSITGAIFTAGEGFNADIKNSEQLAR